MEHAATLQEIAHYMQAVINFAAKRRFSQERRAALIEFFGDQGLPSGDEREVYECFSTYLDWFMFDRVLNSTGQSLVRQFVTEHPGLPDRIRKNLLECERSIYSSFEVKEVKKHCVVLLDLHGEPHDYYAVSDRSAAAELAVGEIITTRLIHWDENYYFYGLIEKWPEFSRAFFQRDADLLQGTRLDPRWRHQIALITAPPPSRSEWVRRKRRRR